MGALPRAGPARGGRGLHHPAARRRHRAMGEPRLAHAPAARARRGGARDRRRRPRRAGRGAARRRARRARARLQPHAGEPGELARRARGEPPALPRLRRRLLRLAVGDRPQRRLHLRLAEREREPRLRRRRSRRPHARAGLPRRRRRRGDGGAAPGAHGAAALQGPRGVADLGRRPPPLPAHERRAGAPRRGLRRLPRHGARHHQGQAGRVAPDVARQPGPAHGAGQPQALPGRPRARAAPRRAHRAQRRAHAARHRPLQAHQRHRGPCRRRRGHRAGGGGAAAAVARRGHRRAAVGRRVRARLRRHGRRAGHGQGPRDPRAHRRPQAHVRRAHHEHLGERGRGALPRAWERARRAPR